MFTFGLSEIEMNKPMKHQAIQFNGFQWVVCKVVFGHLVTLTEFGTFKTMQEALDISNTLNKIKVNNGDA